MAIGWKILIGYLVLTNLVAFVVCGADKSAAQRQKWRVPEKVLFLLSAIGGSLGMYCGMLTFRHKTKHWYFMFGVPALIVLHIGILLFCLRMFSPN